MWWIYALLSAVFAALTAIFAKVGIKGVDTDLATAIRTVVILILAWGIAFFRGGTGTAEEFFEKAHDVPHFTSVPRSISVVLRT